VGQADDDVDDHRAQDRRDEDLLADVEQPAEDEQQHGAVDHGAELVHSIRVPAVRPRRRVHSTVCPNAKVPRRGRAKSVL
jgi:hypothetical protein